MATRLGDSLKLVGDSLKLVAAKNTSCIKFYDPSDEHLLNNTYNPCTDGLMESYTWIIMNYIDYNEKTG